MADNQFRIPPTAPSPVTPEGDALNRPVTSPGAPRPSRIKLAVVAIFLVVVIGVVIALLMHHSGKKTTPHKAVITPQTVAAVQITSTGFVPTTITIKAGSEVNWDNADISQHQIAADPFRTHTSLPELVSQDPLKPRDTFAFTFTQKGTYTYHDELNPDKFKGTVIVE